MIIYKIFNIITEKIYIGQTVGNLRTRINSHSYQKSRCGYLPNSIIKYGKDNFIYMEIDNAETLEELNTKEQFWIAYYQSTQKKFGYNLKEGGDNHRFPDESRIKLSNTTKGRKGKPCSPETKEKLRQYNLGKKLSEETKQKMRQRKHSEETRAKMRKSHNMKKGSINETVS